MMHKTNKDHSASLLYSIKKLSEQDQAMAKYHTETKHDPLSSFYFILLEKLVVNYEREKNWIGTCDDPLV